MANFFKNIMIGKNRGFTLIELLVVVAIIGILASIVLASLGTARDKAGDAAVKKNLSNMRAQAELYYDDNYNYTAVCSDVKMDEMYDEAVRVGSGAGECADGSTTKWAANAKLRSDSTAYWCVDYDGTSKETASDTISEVGTDWDCD